MPTRKPLSAFAVKSLKPDPKGRYEVPDGTPGLRICVHPSGRKVWLLRYRRPADGKNVKLTLGISYDGELAGEPVLGGPLSLAAARQLAAEQMRNKAQGRDPAAERKADKLARKAAANAPAAFTFADAALAYVREYCIPRQRRWWQHASLLGIGEEKKRRRSAFIRPGEPLKLVLRSGGLASVWGSRPLSEITAAEISAVVSSAVDEPLGGRRISAKGPSPSRALALFHALSGMFRWCVSKHKLRHSPMVMMEAPAGPEERERFLSAAEIRAFWACCEDEELASPWHRAALKVLLLTGQRREEIGQMRWEEIDSDELLLVLPGSRTKNRKQHALPLPKAALAILESVPRIAGSPFVFPAGDGARPISNWSPVKRALDAAMARRMRLGKGSEAIGLAPERLKPWRLHDLRRTCSTNLARMGTPIHVTEKLLNHRSGKLGGLVKVYQRYDYKDEVLEALEGWSAEVERIVKVGEASRVLYS
jgi:integrase